MFNEANSVENFIRDLLCGKRHAPQKREVREHASPYIAEWFYIPATQLKRTETDVLVEQDVRDALTRLNPEISAHPDLADEVLYKLRAIILAVRSDGLVRANGEFATWLRGERTMPFGPNNEHTPVTLIDFKHLQNDDYVLTTQLTFKNPEKRFDVVLLVTGIPLVVCEAKTPVRPAISWVDGAIDIHDGYEVSVPAFFVPNVFSFATDTLLPAEASDIVMTVNSGEAEYKQYNRKKEEEEKLLDRFRDPRDPLKFLIVPIPIKPTA